MTAVVAAAAFLSLCAGRVGSEEYLWPMHGPRRLSSSFSEYRAGHYHAGIDLRSYGATGLPCLAVGNGRASRVRVGPAGYGKALYVRLQDGMTAVYAHLEQFTAPIDSLVWQYRTSNGTNWCDLRLDERFPFEVGDTVAWSGQSGTSAPHLHFELRDEAQRPVNPLEGIYSVPDGAPPMISGVMVVPARRGSLSAGSPLPTRHLFRASGNTRFILPDTLQLDGSFGFAVSLWDEQGYGRYRMVPALIELSIDGGTVYTVENRSFSYAQAGQIRLEYYIEGEGPARRYLKLFRQEGVTRDDRTGHGTVGREGSGAPIVLGKGLHLGRIRAVDGAGNESTALFHFQLHDLPEFTMARRLEADDEVVLAGIDPDGGNVDISLHESLDGGATWSALELAGRGGYLRAGVSDSSHALFMARIADDEGAVVRTWFAGPDPSSGDDEVFCEVKPLSTPCGAALLIRTDVPMSRPPLVSAASGASPETLTVFAASPDSFVALAGEGHPAEGEDLFLVSGRDYRGFELYSVSAARVYSLSRGESARFVLADTLQARFEASDVEGGIELVVTELSGTGGPPEGLRPISGPFELDFQEDRLAGPVRLHCEPGPKAGLFVMKPGGEWSCAGVPAMQEGYASIDKPGVYAWFDDPLPPVVRHVALEDWIEGSGFFRDVICSVPVLEPGTGVDPWSATAFLDGERMVCEWDGSRKRLLVPLPRSLEPGRRVLSVEVSDRAGNRSAHEFGFVLD